VFEAKAEAEAVAFETEAKTEAEDPRPRQYDSMLTKVTCDDVIVSSKFNIEW